MAHLPSDLYPMMAEIRRVSALNNGSILHSAVARITDRPEGTIRGWITQMRIKTKKGVISQDDAIRLARASYTRQRRKLIYDMILPQPERTEMTVRANESVLLTTEASNALDLLSRLTGQSATDTASALIVQYRNSIANHCDLITNNTNKEH